jgi:hypothetical protein
MLNRMETWEHLTPEQKQQARQIFGQMRQLPPDRQRQVTTATGSAGTSDQLAALQEHVLRSGARDDAGSDAFAAGAGRRSGRARVVLSSSKPAVAGSKATSA